MNPLEIIQAVFGEEYEFNPTELMRLKQVIDLAVRNCLGWQPIETVPKVPFENLLLWDGEDVRLGFYWPRHEKFYSDFDVVYATHWMPMPELPEES
jgi:hypothetical protein